MKKRYLNLSLIIFTVIFYGYHVEEFGVKSIISTMSLVSCLSILVFLAAFFRVGKQRSIK
ncbi:MAG TPA: hypothetical protein VJ824_17420 [Bacillota bacterium]|nr:hypothetical protein [Bacillota bacterium]